MKPQNLLSKVKEASKIIDHAEKETEAEQMAILNWREDGDPLNFPPKGHPKYEFYLEKERRLFFPEFHKTKFSEREPAKSIIARQKQEQRQGRGFLQRSMEAFQKEMRGVRFIASWLFPQLSESQFKQGSIYDV
jgi:hypothetical protein